MLIDRIKDALVPRLASSERGAEPGLRHYERQVADHNVRYHLRVEPDGAGLLLANAAAACRLSPSGVMIAEGLLSGTTEMKIKSRVRSAFAGSTREKIQNDMERVRQVIDDMAFPGGRYPLFNLDEPQATARDRVLGAPLSAEIGVDGSGDLKARIDRLWDVAVPQVVLIHLPGAPADKLVDGIERAEDHGLIAGVRAPAAALMEEDLLERLAEAGVDHIDAYWASLDSQHHDSLLGDGDHEAVRKVFEMCQRLEVCPVAVIPLVGGGLEHLEAAMSALPEMGVGAATVFFLAEERGAKRSGGIVAEALRQAIATAEEQADRLGLNLVLAPPVERNPDEPLAVQVRRGPRAAGEAAIRVMPDGSVIPSHGPRRAVGNLLSEPFQAIWERDAFRHLRESVEAPPACDECPGLAACSNGCPVDPSGWARLETAEEA